MHQLGNVAAKRPVTGNLENSPMPAAVRRMDEANRRATRVRRDLVEELRRARIQAGVSQRAVAAELGCDKATISRLERAVPPDVGLAHLVRHAAAVGMVLRVDLFPAGAPIRDAGQLKVLNRLQPHVRPPFVWLLEMPVGPNDLRAFDAAAVMPGCRIGFEVWSRVRDAQAQARSSQRKKVDARMDRLVLVFGETAANRSAVRAAGEAVRRAFPLTTRQVLSALREGRDPGADGLVFV